MADGNQFKSKRACSHCVGANVPCEAWIKAEEEYGWLTAEYHHAVGDMFEVLARNEFCERRIEIIDFVDSLGASWQHELIKRQLIMFLFELITDGDLD